MYEKRNALWLERFGLGEQRTPWDDLGERWQQAYDDVADSLVRAALAAEPAPDPRDEALRAAEEALLGITALIPVPDHDGGWARAGEHGREFAGVMVDRDLSRRLYAALARLRAGREG